MKSILSGENHDRAYFSVLNRRLAPIWTLDPTSFAGYLFMQNQLLEEALTNPDSLLRRLGKTIDDENDETMGIVQLSLFPTLDEKPYSIESGDADD